MFLVSFLNLAPKAHLRCLSRKSNFVDVSGLVSGRGSELHLRHLSIRLSFVDVSGLLSGGGSELPSATPVEQIEVRGCFWLRFWSWLEL